MTLRSNKMDDGRLSVTALVLSWSRAGPFLRECKNGSGGEAECFVFLLRDKIAREFC